MVHCGTIFSQMLKIIPRHVFGTLDKANEKRPASFFEAFFGQVYGRCRPIAPKHKFRFKNKLFSLDATTVSLCLSLFPWAKFRKTKAVSRSTPATRSSDATNPTAAWGHVRSNHLVDRTQMGGLSGRPSPSRLPGQGDRQALCLFDQQLQPLRRTIADIYKERWQIETFFRFIKQNLKTHSPGAPWTASVKE